MRNLTKDWAVKWLLSLSKSSPIIVVFFALFVSPSTPLSGQEFRLENQENATVSSSLGSAFIAPPRFGNDLGSFRSPLLFEDGSVVTSAADWSRRRQEILDRWHGFLGQWPELITKPNPKFVASKQMDGYEQHEIQFRWTPNESTRAYLLVPEGVGPFPAIVTVYYEPETSIGLGKPFRDYGLQLVQRGFVVLSIGTTEATRAKTYALYYPDINRATVQPLSMLAYAAANAWYVLASRADVDSSRIGIVGHSFGGKWAMFASCLFDKYACAVWSDPGIVFQQDRPSINYWEPWYLGYHAKPWRKRGLITEQNPARGLYPKLIADGRNLHELHALMAPRPFLVSGGSEDPVHRWRALNHSVRVNEVLGYKNRVAMTNRVSHSPDTQSNAVVYEFFEHFLKQD